MGAASFGDVGAELIKKELNCNRKLINSSLTHWSLAGWS